MLGVFSSAAVTPPEELVAAGCRTPSPKTTAAALLDRFLAITPSAVSVQIGGEGFLAYSHHSESPLQPRSFGAKDEIFCCFEGALDNLGSLRHQYGLSKCVNEVVLVIEAYKALRDRAPYPPSHVVGHLVGNFAFVLFDKTTSTLFVASDQHGRVPLYWGITADGYVAFADDADLLKGACGKSLASFPSGCFYSTAIGELKCYENPKNKVTAFPASEEEIWGAKFKVIFYPVCTNLSSFMLVSGLDHTLVVSIFSDPDIINYALMDSPNLDRRRRWLSIVDGSKPKNLVEAAPLFASTQ